MRSRAAASCGDAARSSCSSRTRSSSANSSDLSPSFAGVWTSLQPTLALAVQETVRATIRLFRLFPPARVCRRPCRSSSPAKPANRSLQPMHRSQACRSRASASSPAAPCSRSASRAAARCFSRDGCTRKRRRRHFPTRASLRARCARARDRQRDCTGAARGRAARGSRGRRARAQIVANVDQAIAGLPPEARKQIDQLFALLAFAPTRCLIAGVWSPWPEASPAAIAAFLARWRDSRFALLQSAYGALHQLDHGGMVWQPECLAGDRLSRAPLRSRSADGHRSSAPVALAGSVS